MRVLEPLQHLEFVIDHLLIALDILLQDDLNGELPISAVGFSHDAIRPGTQSFPESIHRPEIVVSTRGCSELGRYLGLTSYRNYLVGLVAY